MLDHGPNMTGAVIRRHLGCRLPRHLCRQRGVNWTEITGSGRRFVASMTNNPEEDQRLWNSSDRVEEENFTPSIHQIRFASPAAQLETVNSPCKPLQMRWPLWYFTCGIWIKRKDLWGRCQAISTFCLLVVVRSAIFAQQQNPGTFHSYLGSGMGPNCVLWCVSVN